MHSITDWLDRFCYKHPRLGIPNLMMYIVIGNIAVYLLDNFSGGACSAMLAFIPAGILRGQLWRLVTFIFVPASGYNLIFFALFLYMYYFIGNMLEREWGSVKFTVYYGIGVLANVVVGLVLSVLYGANYAWSVVSVDYLNMSLFFAFAALYPDLQFLLFFHHPGEAKMAGLDRRGFFCAVHRHQPPEPQLDRRGAAPGGHRQFPSFLLGGRRPHLWPGQAPAFPPDHQF